MAPDCSFVCYQFISTSSYGKNLIDLMNLSCHIVCVIIFLSLFVILCVFSTELC